jgi:hypothetical protein
MKALTVRQPWATMIAKGIKTREYRSWNPSYRGPLLICAGKKIEREPLAMLEREHPHIVRIPTGVMLCVVELSRVEWDFESNCWAWILSDPRPVVELPVKGKLSLFHVDYALIEYVKT